jgi:hypothetical protein
VGPVATEGAHLPAAAHRHTRAFQPFNQAGVDQRTGTILVTRGIATRTGRGLYQGDLSHRHIMPKAMCRCASQYANAGVGERFLRLSDRLMDR